MSASIKQQLSDVEKAIAWMRKMTRFQIYAAVFVAGMLFAVVIEVIAFLIVGPGHCS